METDTAPTLQKITRFSPRMVQATYPGINVLQMGRGQLKGWTFSSKTGDYSINAGGFNRSVLYEGFFNPGTIHFGFLLKPDSSTVVQAHAYNDGDIALYRGAVPMHEAYPANMAWVNIYAPEKQFFADFPCTKALLKNPSRLLINGPREELLPLIHLIDKHLQGSILQTSHFKKKLQKFLTHRLANHNPEQPFSKGDLFRMHILEQSHKLEEKFGHQPISLAEICQITTLKRRTLQHYFHETYGMGPTEYFHARRLNGAHSELLKGPDYISEVALRWGFTHFGRFSAHYKRLFGEAPRETASFGQDHQDQALPVVK